MDANEIRKWHSVFKRNDELFEIRILAERTLSGYFYDVETAIRQLAPYDNCNIYYSLNEVKAACASREQFNCFRQVKGTATSKSDIEHRWWVAVDVDCERPSGVSSTDAEKERAHKKAQEVFFFLRDNGFGEAVVCDSSSGYHLLLPIDMDNSQESETAIKVFLETLANKFNDSFTKIDTVLHDANRILRLYGTYGRKGRSSAERPHRLAKVLYVPTIGERLSRAKFEAFNAKFEIKAEPTKRRTYNGDASFNLRDFIAQYGIEVVKEIPLSGGGTKYILAECPFDSQHKAPDSALFEMPNGSIAFKCFHDSCSQYDWRAFRLHFDPHAYDYENQPRDSRQWQPQQPVYVQTMPLQPKKKKYEIKDEIPELGEKWQALSSIKKVDITQLEKVKTGFTELDKRIGGLYMSELTVLSGCQASGKSSWLNSLLLNIIEQDYKVALWSGELPAEILKAWILMVAAGADNLRQSQYDEGRYYVPDHIAAKIDAWLDGRFYLYNNNYGTEAEQILNDMEILSNAGVKIFALDNMMAMGIGMFEGDKNDRQKNLVLRIKEFAKATQSHVILVAHPRKTTAFLRKNDISGTGDIINIADNCFIYHRTNEDFIHAITEFYNATKASQLREFGNVLCVEKHRLFGVVDYMCGLHYDPRSRRFMNTPFENKHYSWEAPPEQTMMEFEPRDPSMPFEPNHGEECPY